MNKRRGSRLACITLVALAACAPRPAVSSTPAPMTSTPAASPAASLHAPEIRFALVGSVKNANVWALFDATGYSYNDYAIRSDYWPRLYRLSIPEGQFEPQAAAGMPSEVASEGTLFAATVSLPEDLTWSDGSPFTADDVAFTVNSALKFQLGFDWHAYYDAEWIDHAAAVDAHSVKFFFKKTPNVAAWQYGALQGPVVQMKYWEPRIKDATALLPAADGTAQISALNQKIAELQKRIKALIAEGITATGEQARQLQLELQRRQGDMDQAQNALTKAKAGVDNAMDAARRALYAVDAAGEPALGTWLPAGATSNTWTNEANPTHPFGEPHFDRAVYVVYADEDAAMAAYKNGEVNAVLEPNGLSASALENVVGGIVANPSPVGEFLVFNPSNAKASDPTLRRALFCAVAPSALAGSPAGVDPLNSFVPARNAATPTIACGEGYDPNSAFDPARAVSILKSAGYTWASEPAAEQAGKGLKGPDGQPVPAMVLLAPGGPENGQSMQAAQVVEHYGNFLGIPVSVQTTEAAAIRYAVFNGHSYDMAITRWRLSEYPGYLCEWFGEGNPFGFQDGQIAEKCRQLESTSGLQAAQGQLVQIQERLVRELPFLPLDMELTHDAYTGIRYPFEHMQGGLSSVYGAPSLALPVTP